jgi:hypothetical protein
MRFWKRRLTFCVASRSLALRCVAEAEAGRAPKFVGGVDLEIVCDFRTRAQQALSDVISSCAARIENTAQM